MFPRKTWVHVSSRPRKLELATNMSAVPSFADLYHGFLSCTSRMKPQEAKCLHILRNRNALGNATVMPFDQQQNKSWNRPKTDFAKCGNLPLCQLHNIPISCTIYPKLFKCIPQFIWIYPNLLKYITIIYNLITNLLSISQFIQKISQIIPPTSLVIEMQP